jgi:hypothetical protein
MKLIFQQIVLYRKNTSRIAGNVLSVVWAPNSKVRCALPVGVVVELSACVDHTTS